MPFTTILFGLLLTLLGFGGYVMTRTSSLTALIPAFFGLTLMVLGFLARADTVRGHAMHAAATVALFGFAAAIFSLFATPPAVRPGVALYAQIAMALLTGAFLALCVRSFLHARRARAGRSSCM
jgi:hypothetical protein